MKEFNEWFDENREEFLLHVAGKRDARLGWKAALIWALNHEDLIDHYQLDYVKEELNGD